jgi:hypothetical protein
MPATVPDLDNRTCPYIRSVAAVLPDPYIAPHAEGDSQVITASRIIFLVFIGFVWAIYTYSPYRNAPLSGPSALAMSEPHTAVFGWR